MGVDDGCCECRMKEEECVVGEMYGSFFISLRAK